MLERFTAPARAVVEGAVGIATEAGGGEVRPEHLLAALLSDDGALAVRVLGDAGVSLDTLRSALDRQRRRYLDGLDADDAEALREFGIDLDEVVRRIARDPVGPRRSGRPRLSRSSKKVLELSLREAVSLRHGYIGTEHLLLALVRQGDRVVADSLREAQVDGPALRALVVETVREAG